MTLGKQRLWSCAAFTWIAPTIGFLVLLECGARIVDVGTGFHSRLLHAFSMIEQVADPTWVPDLAWPEGAVAVRSASERAVAAYSIGGRVIVSPGVASRTTMIAPTALRDSERLVFVVGGSAAFGFPYPEAASFAAVLDQMLEPEGFRVLNAGRVGASSGTVREIVERILSLFDVHTLVVMTGNNEWIRWKPDAATQAASVALGLRRTLAQSRAAALVMAWSLRRQRAAAQERAQRARASHGDRGGFLEHFELAGSEYALRFADEVSGGGEEGWLRVRYRYLEVFEENLREIIRRAEGATTRVLLLTVPFNYRLAPAWKHPQPLYYDPDSEALARRAVAAADGPPSDHSLQVVEAALAAEPHSPILHYLRAEMLEALARPAEAEKAYEQSREHMVGNLGSRLGINGSIERTATQTGVSLIDVRRIFDAYEHERDRYFNEDLVHDDCHPTPLGHRLIAEALRRHF